MTMRTARSALFMQRVDALGALVAHHPLDALAQALGLGAARALFASPRVRLRLMRLGARRLQIADPLGDEAAAIVAFCAAHPPPRLAAAALHIGLGAALRGGGMMLLKSDLAPLKARFGGACVENALRHRMLAPPLAGLSIRAVLDQEPLLEAHGAPLIDAWIHQTFGPGGGWTRMLRPHAVAATLDAARMLWVGEAIASSGAPASAEMGWAA